MHLYADFFNRYVLEYYTIHCWLNPQMQKIHIYYYIYNCKVICGFLIARGFGTPNLCVVQGLTVLDSSLRNIFSDNKSRVESKSPFITEAQFPSFPNYVKF